MLKLGASQMALVVKNPPANTGDVRDVGSIHGWDDPLEEDMATHSSVLPWRSPWIEEPGGLGFIGSQRAGHNKATACLRACFNYDLVNISFV